MNENERATANYAVILNLFQDPFRPSNEALNREQPRPVRLSPACSEPAAR